MPEGFIPDVAKPGAFKPDREFVFAEFISAKPACGIRSLLTGRESICNVCPSLDTVIELGISIIR